ncbi:hypothetical protein PVAND_017251 [Polypedilum vanderplanki]|uniref:F-box domain-containing protein n=1 Tax=Polypedilum vanderplanki TaxID=319348 RepID=A0A9J6BHQ6_POLVA|nr:hypothetical protein PVAND_017251 [Polypedilum vanderplanki]
MENLCVNILSLPNEVLLKIIKLAENDKNLSLTCFRFYELVKKSNEKNISLFVDYRYLVNPNFNLDNFIENSSTISLTIDNNFPTTNNFEEKLEFFLHQFGRKVTKLIIGTEIKNFSTKFLPLMPNLCELEIHKEILSEKIESKKFNLKKLKISCNMNLEELKIFRFDELEINSVYFSNPLKLIEFMKEQKHLKTIKIHNNDFNIDFTKALKLMKLENLELLVFYGHQKMIGNCLRNQRMLKKLSLADITREVFLIICDNLKELRFLSFSFCYHTSAAFLYKLSNLKYLKFLAINSCFDRMQFNELMSAKLENLESLTISIVFDIPIKQIQICAENFNNLKFLSLTFFSSIHLNVISEIFDRFKTLRNLQMNFANNVRFTEIDERNFYNLSHKNENLKSLIFDSRIFDIEKLISKFILDFPNLEILNLGIIEGIKENVELLLTGFPNLKKIENLIIDDELLETFLVHGKNLEEFDVYINMFEKPNEMLKDCSLSLKIWHSLAKVTREKITKIELTLLIYSHWKKIRTLMDSNLQLKNLSIYSLVDHNYCDNVLMQILKVIGKPVKNLTICGTLSNHQLKIFIKSVPNCRSILFDCICYLKENEKILQLKNSKIKSICVSVDLNYSRLENEVEKLNDLLKNIEFPTNCFRKFKFKIKNTDKIGHRNLNFIANQEKMISKKENWNEENREYVYEFSFDKTE